jgi:hypothetical protein
MALRLVVANLKLKLDPGDFLQGIRRAEPMYGLFVTLCDFASLICLLPGRSPCKIKIFARAFYIDAAKAHTFFSLQRFL